MRVLHAISEMGAGGAERIVVELSRSLSEDGDEVAVAGQAGRFDQLLEGIPVSRYEIPGRGRSPRLLAKSAVAIRSAMRSFGAELIHAHNVKMTAVTAGARAANRAPRPPLVTTFHGVHPREYRAAALVLRSADVIACVSEDLRTGLEDKGLSRAKLRVIPNAVRLPAPLSAERRRALDEELGVGAGPVVSLVGRLVAQKAPERFVEAAARIAPQIDDITFLVVGEGPLRSDLERMARESRLERSVRFTGARNDAREIIARSDLVVFSSEWEGQSLVALEAMAAAVPVVATEVEGMSELLAGGGGVLVSRDAAALAEAVVRLLGDAAGRDRMGRAGRATVGARFSVSAMVSSYRELYREALEERNPISRRRLSDA